MNRVDQADRIRTLNDTFRSTLIGGKVLLTPAVHGLPSDLQAKAIFAVRNFNAFDSENDPYHEHDFGSFELDGERYFFKIDYYGLDMSAGSENPADINVTTRVLTIMHASEY